MPSYNEFGIGGIRLGSDIVTPSEFGRDDFTGAIGASVTSRDATPFGGTWSLHPSYSGTSVLTAAGRARPGTSQPLLLFSRTSPRADYSVGGKLYVRSSTQGNAFLLLALRASAVDNTAYFGGLYYDFFNDVYSWRIIKLLGGASTTLATAAASISLNSTYDATFQAVGTELRLYNGTQIVTTATDSSITSIGRAGYWIRGGSLAANDTNDIQLDDWTLGDNPYFRIVYNPLHSGGVSLGGHVGGDLAPNVVGSGGFRLGGFSGPSLASSRTPSGGFRLGGTSDPTLLHNYTNEGVGGFRVGGAIGSQSAGNETGTGGFELGAENPRTFIANPGSSGGFSLGGTATPVGNRTLYAYPIGGIRLGGAATRTAAWTISVGGGVRLGGRFIGTYDNPHDASGGFSLGGGKLPTDYREEGVGGIRFGGRSRPIGIIYRIYQNDGSGGPVDYSAPIIETARLLTDVEDVAYPGDYTWHIRVYDSFSGLEEQNIDGRLRLILDASGNDVTRMPAAPSALAAEPLPGGDIRVTWLYMTPSGRSAPSEFRLYGGTPVVSYATPLVVVPYTGDRRYWAVATGLQNQQPYRFGVRAANSVAEEPNLVYVDAVSDGLGPRPPEELTITAV